MSERKRKQRSDAGKRRNVYADVHISVRLNPGKDPEKHPDRRCIEILYDWTQRIGENGQRLTMKDVVCRGILALEGEIEPGESQVDDVLSLFDERLEQFAEILERLEQMGIEAAPRQRKGKKESAPAIDPNYLANLAKAMRGGGE